MYAMCCSLVNSLYQRGAGAHHALIPVALIAQPVLFVPWVQMLLKCADIGHLAADTETHKRWAYQLEEEFFQQVGLRRPCMMGLCPPCTLLFTLPLCPIPVLY